MHETMTSIKSIWCMAKHRENYIQHNGIIGFLMTIRHTWTILTLAYETAKWNKKHGFQT